MKPYYQHGGVTIYHGDCREVLPGMSFDLLLTDPPYGIHYVTAWRSRSDKLRSPLQNDASSDVFAEAWPLCTDGLRDDRHWYVFSSPRMLPAFQQIVGSSKHTVLKSDRERKALAAERRALEALQELYLQCKGQVLMTRSQHARYQRLIKCLPEPE